MKFVTLRELKINPSQVLDGLGRHDVVVIRKGKPAAAVIYLDEDMLDDFVLAHHASLLREVKAARAEYLKTGGIDHATMKKRVARRG
jgi:antitoxin (DNA-binding transcriptional repressor) of toxin-antitoxin stability system